MDRARLDAFADNELSPEEAAAVVMHLADHPADQAYVDEVMAANALLARAHAGPMAEPVPEAIRRAILGAEVVPLRRRLPALGIVGAALAAGVAALALLWPGAGAPPALLPGPLAPGGAVHAAVTGLASGTPSALADGSRVMVLATLPTPSGHCREVERVDPAAGVLTMALACEQGGAWRIEVALSEPLPEAVEAEGFVPAGGAETAGLTPWLDRVGAGLALDAEAEAGLIARDWRP
jgi:hypothetical protein